MMKAIRLRYINDLQKLFEIQDKIRDIHPFLERVFPIAIVEDRHFLVFDIDSSGKKYIFIKEALSHTQYPKGVKAAFPLECYEDKMACVISSGVFGSIEAYITIFHEFVHCCQFQICELKLKQKLDIAQKAMAKKDYMWELNYPFPYGDGKFTEVYFLFLKATQEHKLDDIFKYRSKLKRILSKTDFEYMVWQEWKEGFARLIENKIRCRLSLKENHYGMERPFHRISFYVGGSRFIKILGKQEPELLVNIEELFYKMLNGNG